ncbi:MAG: hypothetical protein WC647_12100 [Desulfomonilaceae bacterium]
MKRRFFIVSVILKLVIIPSFLSLHILSWAGSQDDLQAVIKDYFEAEMSRNADKVWNLLAPSSIFKKFYSYENYLELCRSNPIRVLGYELKFPPEISENNDKGNLPNVEKIGTVVIKVRLKGDSGKESENISVFIFLFENGSWYKG